MFLCLYKTYKVSLNRHFNISHSFILLFSILHGLRGPLKPRIPNVYWDFASGRQELNSCCDITRMRPCLRSQSRAPAPAVPWPRSRSQSQTSVSLSLQLRNMETRAMFIQTIWMSESDFWLCSDILYSVPVEILMSIPMSSDIRYILSYCRLP